MVPGVISREAGQHNVALLSPRHYLRQLQDASHTARDAPRRNGCVNDCHNYIKVNVQRNVDGFDAAIGYVGRG